MRKFSVHAVLAILMLASVAAPRIALAEEITLTHVHGLTYIADGKHLKHEDGGMMRNRLFSNS